MPHNKHAAFGGTGGCNEGPIVSGTSWSGRVTKEWRDAFITRFVPCLFPAGGNDAGGDVCGSKDPWLSTDIDCDRPGFTFVPRALYKEARDPVRYFDLSGVYGKLGGGLERAERATITGDGFPSTYPRNGFGGWKGELLTKQILSDCAIDGARLGYCFPDALAKTDNATFKMATLIGELKMGWGCHDFKTEIECSKTDTYIGDNFTSVYGSNISKNDEIPRCMWLDGASAGDTFAPTTKEPTDSPTPASWDATDNDSPRDCFDNKNQDACLSYSDENCYWVSIHAEACAAHRVPADIIEHGRYFDGGYYNGRGSFGMNVTVGECHACSGGGVVKVGGVPQLGGGAIVQAEFQFNQGMEQLLFLQRNVGATCTIDGTDVSATILEFGHSCPMMQHYANGAAEEYVFDSPGMSKKIEFAALGFGEWSSIQGLEWSCGGVEYSGASTASPVLPVLAVLSALLFKWR